MPEKARQVKWRDFLKKDFLTAVLINLQITHIADRGVEGPIQQAENPVSKELYHHPHLDALLECIEDACLGQKVSISGGLHSSWRA